MSFTLSKIGAHQKVYNINVISIHGIPIKFRIKYHTTLKRNRHLIAPLISVANFGNKPDFHPRRKDTLDRIVGIRNSSNGKKR